MRAMSEGQGKNENWATQLFTSRCPAQFNADSVPERTLESILQAGCQTVSPWNLKPWQFIVVRSPARKQQVLEHCPDPGPAASAPILLVGVGDPQAWKRAPARLVELARAGSLPPGGEAAHLERIRRQWGAGQAARLLAFAQTYAALQQTCLAALAQDVWSCWVADFDAEGLARALNIPAHLVVVGVVALGHCSQRIALPMQPLGRTVFAEAYGLPLAPEPEGS